LSDLKTIIERYDRFIEQNKDTPVVAQATQDLATWKDRLAKGMVKVGTQWVLPEQRAEIQEKALLAADQARELLKQNKLKDADAAVTRALDVDPTNVSALYLKGLILYRQDQIQAARKAFEAVKEAMPDHGPALNNLAVILWRQNQPMAAMGAYLQAMQAMPMNKELLNNVAEALNSLTDEQRKSPVAQKVIKLWTEQDAQLQQQLMTVGWYRWGSSWVDKSQYDKLQVAEKEVKDKIAKMEADFADAQAKIDTIDSQMQQNRQAMQYMEQQRMQYNTTQAGKTQATLYPLPPAYWDYDRANRRLEVQRKETITLLDTLRAKAQAVKQQLPLPKYKGLQVMIGVEGTPIIAPVPKTTVSPVANLKDEVAPTPAAAVESGKGTVTETPKTEAPKGETAKPGTATNDKPLKY
jgi:tetratricopeptide (TPR) repeat protein